MSATSSRPGPRLVEPQPLARRRILERDRSLRLDVEQLGDVVGPEHDVEGPGEAGGRQRA